MTQDAEPLVLDATGACLRRAVLCDPSDALARGAYADWLEEHGRDGGPVRRAEPLFSRRPPSEGARLVTHAVTQTADAKALADLFRTHPVLAVLPADVRPYAVAPGASGLRWSWGDVGRFHVRAKGRRDPWVMGGGVPQLCWVGSQSGRSSRVARTFPTVRAAFAALSPEIVNWGRHAAGLPPLVWEDVSVSFEPFEPFFNRER